MFESQIALATIEIFTMLFGAFLIGIVFGWTIKPSKDAPAEFTKVSLAREEELLEKKEDSPKKHPKDNLELIEGIGPKTLEVLQKYGVYTFKDLLLEDVEGLRQILSQAGEEFAQLDPITWPDQARLAKKKKWKELEEYQDILLETQKIDEEKTDD